VYGPIGKIHQVDMGEFENTLRINFLGTVFMCHFFLPLLLRCHGSRIVNYSGGGSTTPFPHYDAYATSKVAIVRFTENVARESLKVGVTQGEEILKNNPRLFDTVPVP
jgi:NAD(P)-dependent dehydrogenase (short-subunit alcohol dehydrogenase family)